MILLDFISSEDLIKNCECERVKFLTFEDNKITFRFMYDVFRNKWIEYAIAGKFDAKIPAFKILIAIDEPLTIVKISQRQLFKEKVTKEFKPFKEDIENQIKLNIIDYLLSNPEFNRRSSFMLHDEKINI